MPWVGACVSMTMEEMAANNARRLAWEQAHPRPSYPTYMPVHPNYVRPNPATTAAPLVTFLCMVGGGLIAIALAG